MKHILIFVFFLTISVSAYASNTISLILGFPPGSTTDLVARQVAKDIAANGGPTIIVENKVGDSGNIAIRDVVNTKKNEPPKLLITTNSIYINAYVTKSINVDLDQDLKPVAFVGYTTMILLASTESNIRKLSDLNTGSATVRVGSVNAGVTLMGMNHLAGQVRRPLEHIPYKGSIQAMTDLVGNHIDLVFDYYNSSQGFIRSGKAIPIAVSGQHTLKELPQVKTFQAQGVNWTIDPFFMLFASNNIDPVVIKSIQAALSKTYAGNTEDYQRQGLVLDPNKINTVVEFNRESIHRYQRMKITIKTVQ